jgi:hypothetical protein
VKLDHLTPNHARSASIRACLVILAGAPGGQGCRRYRYHWRREICRRRSYDRLHLARHCYGRISSNGSSREAPGRKPGAFFADVARTPNARRVDFPRENAPIGSDPASEGATWFRSWNDALSRDADRNRRGRVPRRSRSIWRCRSTISPLSCPISAVARSAGGGTRGRGVTRREIAGVRVAFDVGKLRR